ncbi:RagB/SusD family nutrient uptake outer membrane protein [Membranihabitans marinus]|uniref:RagB/SusD family nutrient uptake outer membrane protein n=1 Tax=Membranihabitans marinus TaxID=1227546 RepID=UPI001F1FA273|nr:RagB/SusD family nutrient uptake outer membrane protein [Membranihabitans marinus]
MKNIVTKYYLFLFVLLGFSSCTEDLTLSPISEITNASFWTSKEEAEGALNGIYVRLRTQAASNLFALGEARSEVWTQNFGFDPSANFYVFTNDLSSTNAGPDWTTFYSVIHDANLILKYVPEIDFVDEGEKNQILAEAHAMRAFVYFIMTKTWGDLILVTEPTEDFAPESIYKERTSQSLIFDFIKKDIDDAIALFPNSDFMPGRNKWSKPAAQTLKADVYLWTAKRLNGGSSDFNEALSALEEVELSQVALLDNYSDVFAFEAKGNDEIIMSIRFEEGESSARTIYGGITGIIAPVFPYTDAETIAKVSPFEGRSSFWQVSRDVAAQFDTADSRKEGNFYEVFETRDGVTSFMYNTDLKWPGVITGGVRVMYDDYILYRYADVVLMKAEAKNALGQDPSEEINIIRKRAFGDQYPGHEYTSSTQEENDEVILQERLFEFLHEGKRWWDLVRFDKAFEKVPSLQGRGEHLLLFPINDNILSLEPLVEQNPGY